MSPILFALFNSMMMMMKPLYFFRIGRSSLLESGVFLTFTWIPIPRGGEGGDDSGEEGGDGSDAEEEDEEEETEEEVEEEEVECVPE